MKIYIPTKGRASTMTTHRLLDAAGVDYRIVVHNVQEYHEYTKNPTISPLKVLISNVEYGLCQQRQWILERVNWNDWVLMMDDNILEWDALDDSWYNEPTVPTDLGGEFTRASGRWNRVLTASELVARVQEDTQVAEERGARLIGYDLTGNPLFRGKHYRDVGYVIGKMIAVRRGPLMYDTKLRSIDDFDWTAQNLYRYGRVLINHYIWPKAPHYQPGGLGTYEERLPLRRADCARIMAKWPQLFAYTSRGGKDPTADLRLRFHSLEAIDVWRHNLRAQAQQRQRSTSQAQ